MRPEEYSKIQVTLLEIAIRVEGLDIEGFLRCIQRSKSLAPIVDPTLFLRASDNLDAIEELAEAFLKVKERLQKTREAVIQTAVAHIANSPPDDYL